MTGFFVSTRLLQRIAAVWVLACSAYFYVTALANPYAEWDMLVYAASAELLNDTPYEEIHAKVYSELEQRLSAEEFERITSDGYYREVMYHDPEAFMEQLPFYRIRVTFNSLMAFASRNGIDVYTAGHVISATAVLCCFLFIWFAFRHHIHPALQLLLPVAFYKYTRELQVMEQILADSLACLWVAFICYAYAKRSRLLYPLLAVAVLVRVDLFIFAGLMLMLLLLTERIRNWGYIIITGAIVVGVFLAIQRWADSYGWQALYYFAIISEMSATHPSAYSTTGFSFSEYVHSLFYPPRWISKMYVITIVCSAVTLYLSRRNNAVTDFQQRLCEVSGICLIYIAVHYLIFPQLYLRFFVAQNMMVFTAFVVLVSGYLRFPLSIPGSIRQSPISQCRSLHNRKQ